MSVGTSRFGSDAAEVFFRAVASGRWVIGAQRVEALQSHFEGVKVSIGQRPRIIQWHGLHIPEERRFLYDM
jgi:hypothetical protein